MSERREGDPRVLVDTILGDARREAEELLKAARESAEARRRGTEERRSRMLEEAEQTAAEREATIRKNAESRMEIERRREQLKVRDEIAQKAMEAVRDRLASMAGEPGYREILKGWIAEAAVGLGEPRADVNATAAERRQIDESLLAEVEERVMRATGREVSLSLSRAQPLLSQGVVLTSEDGRVAYNNQVATRILRMQSEIRKLIHQELFS